MNYAYHHGITKIKAPWFSAKTNQETYVFQNNIKQPSWVAIHLLVSAIWIEQWQTRQINKPSTINHKVRITVLTSQSLMYSRTSFREHNILLITHSYLFIANSTTVIKKIKEFPRSFFNVIPRYVTRMQQRTAFLKFCIRITSSKIYLLEYAYFNDYFLQKIITYIEHCLVNMILSKKEIGVCLLSVLKFGYSPACWYTHFLHVST